MTPKQLLREIEVAVQIQTGEEIERSGSFGWFTLPHCPECGKERHFAFHPSLGYICHKCQVSGKVGSLIWFLRQHGFQIGKDPPLARPAPDQKFPGFLGEPAQERPCYVALPKEAMKMKRCEVPRYFEDTRGYDPRILLQLNLHFCYSGRYAGYLIVPLKTEKHEAFLAYDTHRDLRALVSSHGLTSSDHLGKARKVLYPEGCQISRFLFPYQIIKLHRPNRLILCEGTTDALRLLSLAWEAPNWPLGLPLALLGKKISPYHRATLARLTHESDIREISVCLDQDTESTGHLDHDGPLEAAHYLDRGGVRCSVSVLRLSLLKQQNIDPDDVLHWQDWLHLERHKEIVRAP